MTRQRIILHPGFHKTGTTTVQDFLHRNGSQIWPTTALGLDFKFPALLQAARGYSAWRDPFTLEKFARRLAGFLDALDLPPHRKLVISAEQLSGHLPGREGITDYSALPALMQRAIEVMEARFPNGLDLTIYLSTRAPDTWLDSAWAEHVKASRMRLDRDTFRNRYAKAADLDGMVTRLRTAVDYPVVSHRIEDTRDLPLGPAAPLIALIGLPDANRQRLVSVPARNTRLPDAVLHQLLALNRSDLPPQALHSAKRAVITRHNTNA